MFCLLFLSRPSPEDSYCFHDFLAFLNKLFKFVNLVVVAFLGQRTGVIPPRFINFFLPKFELTCYTHSQP